MFCLCCAYSLHRQLADGLPLSSVAGSGGLVSASGHVLLDLPMLGSLYVDLLVSYLNGEVSWLWPECGMPWWMCWWHCGTSII